MLVLNHYLLHCETYGLSDSIAGTPIFYFISGFVISMSFERQSIKKFLIKRLFRLYPVIFFMYFILFFVMMVIKHQAKVNGVDVDVKNIIMNIFFIPHFFPSNNSKLTDILYVGPMWTICIDFTFYLILILTKSIKSQKNKIIFIVFFNLFLIYVMTKINEIYHIYGTMLSVLYYLLSVYFGMLVYYLSQNYITKKCFIILAICILYPLFFDNTYCRYVIGGLTMLYLFTYHKELGNNKIVLFFAHISYPMFLLHSIFPNLIFSHSSVCLKDREWYYFPILYISMIPICYFIYRFIEEPMNKFGRRITQNMK